MNKKIITFGDNEIQKRKFHCSKNVDIDNSSDKRKIINTLLVTWMMSIKSNCSV